MITDKQRKQIFALLNKSGFTGERAEIVHQFTNGRATSTAKLTVAEANDMIGWLKTVEPIDQGKASRDNMVRKLLAQFHQMGWYKADVNGVWVLNGSGQPSLDYGRINAWCVKYTRAKKPFGRMNSKELSTAVSVAEKMKNEYNSKKV